MWIMVSGMVAGMILIMFVLHQLHNGRGAGTQGIHHTLYTVGTRIIKGLLLAGVPVGPMILLTVRGRKTGQPRTIPVDLFERDGRRFLVSTHGEGNANWVRNLRAAGEGTITRGHHQQTVSAVELTPEVAGPVLKEVLGPRLAMPVRGYVLRRTMHMSPNASVDEFISAARIHPVFELGSPPEVLSKCIREYN